MSGKRNREEDIPVGAMLMPDFDKIAEICRKPIEDTRPLEPHERIVKQAYSVKWIWAWLTMHGYKDTEYRSSPPRHRLRGRCAVHLSRHYAKSAYDEDLASIREDDEYGAAIAAQVPPYEELARHAGKIVGVVDFDATDGDGTEWAVSNPVWLKRFIPLVGHPSMYFLPQAVADDINRQLTEIENKKGA